MVGILRTWNAPQLITKEADQRIEVIRSHARELVSCSLISGPANPPQQLLNVPCQIHITLSYRRQIYPYRRNSRTKRA